MLESMAEHPACEITHRQIRVGTCSWCQTAIGDSAGMGPIGDEGVSLTEWDLDAMRQTLREGDCDARSYTLNNLEFDGAPAIGESLPLLALVLDDPDSQLRLMAEFALSHHGRSVTSDEAEALERRLAERPDQLAARIVLLSYYFGGRRLSPGFKRARQEHQLWVIENAPDSHTAGAPEARVMARDEPAEYALAKQLWLQQVERRPGEAAVLGNAASFFQLNDKELCEELLRRAQRLEPNNPAWSEQLARLYTLQSRGDDEQSAENARRAYTELRAAELKRDASLTGSEDSAESKGRRLSTPLLSGPTRSRNWRERRTVLASTKRRAGLPKNCSR
ncbi:hypothetical protein KOR34_42740 [Posidoniimonas corsicana]|uniref:Tetratricopeptide repeat protein n=2 Tax=Posidoniimonas corsicana TaxID=1938618 RepID=A0A5C5V287_9BACT|nr:hypothetical protein KOR34_42740 [Posidoniimonas corsicana]